MEDPHLLGRSTVDSYATGVRQAVATLAGRIAKVRQPYSGASVAQLQGLVDGIDLDRPLGTSGAALDEVARIYLEHAVWFHEPGYVSHLNCPVAIPALTAEVLISAVNSSVDTWDQSTTGTLIEQRMIEWTAGRLGLGPDADGVFTSGGTQSNLHGLLLAREECLAGRPDDRAELQPRLRVLATTESHFSVSKAAALLGLARDAVVPVATDDRGRMDPESLVRIVDELRGSDLVPMAVVATAGTTDLGCIDPLNPIGATCAQRGVWLHVDAAYGCGLLVSRRRRHLIDGIGRADSVTVDYHKSFFQPVSSSAILVRRSHTLRRITVHADYLNPRTATVPNQVDKSLQTTRRLDALKLWMTLRTMGADHLGDLFDRVVDLARDTHALVGAEEDFEVAVAPTLSTLLFRYRPAWLDVADCDRLMPVLRDRLFHQGQAIVAMTTLGGHTWLKFTLLNPNTTVEHLRSIVGTIRDAGRTLLDEEFAPAVEAVA